MGRKICAEDSSLAIQVLVLKAIAVQDHQAGRSSLARGPVKMPRKTKGPQSTAKQPNGAPDVAWLVTFLRTKMHDAQAIPTIREHLLQIDKHLPATQSGADVAMLASTLADVMAAQPQHARLQISVCNCLHKITRTCVSLPEKSGANTVVIPAIVNAMSNHADNADLQDAATEALAQLAADLDRKDTDHVHMPPQATIDFMMLACLDALKRYATRIRIQSQAFVAMKRIFNHSPASHQLLMEGGAVGVIVKGMRAFRDCVLLQLQGSALLSYLIVEHGPDKQVFWKEGALSMILKAMDVILLGSKRRESKFEVKGKAFSCRLEQPIEPIYFMGHFGTIIEIYGDESQEHEERGLLIIPQACARYLDNVKVQTLGMEAIYRALSNCPKNCAHVGREGIRAALCAMAVHDKVEDVQVYGTLSLQKMVLYNSTNSHVIVEDNGLRILMRNVDMYSKTRVEDDALCLLTIMANEAELRLYEELINAGCVRAICKSIHRQTCLSSQLLQDAALERNALRNAAFVLSACSDPRLSLAMRSRVLKEGAIGAAIHVMSVDKHSTVHLLGCTNIISLFHEHHDNITAAGLLVLPALVDAILTHPDNMPVQHQACFALNLVGQDIVDSDSDQLASYQQIMGKCGGLRALIQCIKLYAHPNDFDSETQPDGHVFAYACVGLYYAAMHHPCNTQYCKSNGGWEAYLAAFNHHKGNEAYEDDLNCARAVFMGEPSEGARRDLYATEPNFQYASPDCTAHGAPRTNASASKQLASSQAMSTTHVRQSHDACVACGKTAQDSGMAKLLKCSACMLAPMYCSAACQRSCWPQHKVQCKANKKKNTK